MTQAADKPVIALTLGDPAGIGPELIARLLDRPDTMEKANVVLVGDAWLWEDGQKLAGHPVECIPVKYFAEVRGRTRTDRPAFLGTDTITPSKVHRGKAIAAGGASALAVLNRCLVAASAGQIDGICFAPLNKFALKLGGMKHEDELHHFAKFFGVTDYFCEFNTLGDLWTARVSSHVPLKSAAKYIEKSRVIDAATLIYRALQAAGVASPRVAVAGFNPHNGDGGTCGREEIDVIEPAVRMLNARGMAVVGPFPADTIFLRARNGEFDAVVTMYHDQGQIAIKLLGFDKGVTVQGGLPVPITTPAHGTAYDIAGLGKADVNATANAFALVCRMAIAKRTTAAAAAE